MAIAQAAVGAAAVPASDAAAHGSGGVALLTIFVLSVFGGSEVICQVSAVLHPPLRSGAYALPGLILVGAIIVAGEAEGWLELTLAATAVVLSAINLVGGFVVTDRMLERFKPRQSKPEGAQSGKDAA